MHGPCEFTGSRFLGFDILQHLVAMTCSPKPLTLISLSHISDCRWPFLGSDNERRRWLSRPHSLLLSWSCDQLDPYWIPEHAADDTDRVVDHFGKLPHEAAFEGVVLEPPLRCDDEPLNNDCQMNASLRSNSMSFSVQSLVGRA